MHRAEELQVLALRTVDGDRPSAEVLGDAMLERGLSEIPTGRTIRSVFRIQFPDEYQQVRASLRSDPIQPAELGYLVGARRLARGLSTMMQDRSPFFRARARERIVGTTPSKMPVPGKMWVIGFPSDALEIYKGLRRGSLIAPTLLPNELELRVRDDRDWTYTAYSRRPWRKRPKSILLFDVIAVPRRIRW